MFEIDLITDFVSVEVRSFSRLQFLEVSSNQVVFISPSSEAHLRLDQFSYVVFVEVLVGAEIPLIQLTGELPSIDSVEVKDLVGFEMSCDAQAFGNVFRLYIGTW